MAALDALLTVQEHDTAADRLRHRRASLPERADLVAREHERDRLDVLLTDASARRADVLAQEKRLDDEATSLEAKAKEMERKLYGGTVSNVKELQAMEADVKSLRHRRDELEELELEVMEQREVLDREVAGLEAQLAEVQAVLDTLSSAIATAEAEIDHALSVEDDARRAAAVGLAADLLSTYDSIRAKNRGIGAARLVGDTCQACRLSLPATEVERIRRSAPGAVARCENCGALLVHS
jgi:predicted  nucleic acid-binding Zn-ribbon protein